MYVKGYWEGWEAASELKRLGYSITEYDRGFEGVEILPEHEKYFRDEIFKAGFFHMIMAAALYRGLYHADVNAEWSAARGKDSLVESTTVGCDDRGEYYFQVATKSGRVERYPLEDLKRERRAFEDALRKAK